MPRFREERHVDGVAKVNPCTNQCLDEIFECVRVEQVPDGAELMQMMKGCLRDMIEIV